MKGPAGSAAEGDCVSTSTTGDCAVTAASVATMVPVASTSTTNGSFAEPAFCFTAGAPTSAASSASISRDTFPGVWLSLPPSGAEVESTSTCASAPAVASSVLAAAFDRFASGTSSRGSSSATLEGATGESTAVSPETWLAERFRFAFTLNKHSTSKYRFHHDGSRLEEKESENTHLATGSLRPKRLIA